jgi:DNA-binding CsgD family transcriptional regulator
MESLIDRIYEAALIPEHWAEVLETLNRIGGGLGTTMFASSDGPMRWRATPGLYELVRGMVESGELRENDRHPRALALDHAGFIGDQHLFAPEERLQSTLHQRFLSPNGLGWCAGTLIRPPSGDVMVLSIERLEQDGPATPEILRQLDALRPHLARATLIASRLQMQQARAAVAALDMMGLPAAMLGRNGHSLAMNDLLAAMTPQLVQDRQDRLQLTDREADPLLATALESLRAAQGTTTRSIPIPAREGQSAMVVHLVPVRGQARDIFDNTLALLVVTPVTHGGVAQADVIQGLFDLTPAEARVARSIATGNTPELIAQVQGVSVETVRKQLAAVLAKTGLRRQASLVGLLTGTAPPPG